MARNTAPKLERPCANPACGHLHEGTACMEDDCKCEKYIVAEVPTPAEASKSTEPEAIAHQTTPGTQETFPGNPAVLFAGDATIQSRIGQLLEAFEDLGEPVGCEVTLYSDQKFKWNGSEMVEVVATPAAPAVPTLSDEDVAKLRDVVNSQNPAKELPDGSVLVPIRVDADTLNMLKGWAEGTNEPWEIVLQRTAEMGLNAVVNGGAVAG